MNKVLIEKELGAMPSITEMEVADILVINKIPEKSVKFLRPSRKKGTKTPDLLIDNSAYWEIKSLEKLGKYTLERALRVGLMQANNIIVDLRKLTITLEKKATIAIKKEFIKRKNWNGLVIVVRPDGKCLTFKK